MEATLRGDAILAWSGVGRFASPREGAAAWAPAAPAHVDGGDGGPGLEAAYARYRRGVELVKWLADDPEPPER